MLGHQLRVQVTFRRHMEAVVATYSTSDTSTAKDAWNTRGWGGGSKILQLQKKKSG